MACLVCGGAVAEKLDVGAHPVASFYLSDPAAAEVKHRLAVGQCDVCATIQLMQPVPHSALIPPVDWIFAREPEEHLDAVVDQVRVLPGVTPASVIAGLTSKDDTTLDRFRKYGFENIWRVDVRADLGVENPNANIETVQKLTNPERMRAIAEKRGAADVLFVRHIIEHAEDLQSFVHGVAALVKPGGYVMVECPDCAKSLDLADYCMVWEEHSLYFTSATFEHVMSMAGFETVALDVHPFPFENSLVLIARKTGAPGPAKVSAAARQELGLLDTYAARYAPTSKAIRAYLEQARAEGPVAIFGAGHLACAFALFHGVSDLIDFVADDTPQKQGLYLPGAKLPILPSAALVERGVKLCLFAVSPNSEDRIAERNSAFIAAGGRFRSILAASRRSLRHETAAFAA